MFKLRWGFYTEGLNFDGSPIEQQALGGSESALWSMAREQAARGSDVEVFCNCPKPGLYDGVRYSDVSEFRKRAAIGEWDVFVAHRFYPALAAVARSKMNWLWLHDMPVDTKRMCASLYATDQVVVLSDFHRAEYVKAEPGLEPILWQSRNGVDLGLIDGASAGAERKRKLFVYASRPERGLGFLLAKVWPKLYAADPERQLVVTSYDMKGFPLAPGLQDHYRDLEGLMAQTPGVVNAKALPKKDFYRLLATAGAVLYPTQFPEISCIVAIEAQAAGAPVIATHGFALAETVAYSAELGLTDPSSEDFADRFVAKVEEVVANDILYRRLQREGKNHVQGKYPWQAIAAAWEQRANELFAKRASENPRRVYEQLVHESDLVSAREYLASGIPVSEIAAGDDPERHPLQDWAGAQHRWLDELLDKNHHEDPEAYSEGAGEQVNVGWDVNDRFAKIASLVPKGRLRVLDAGCGAGGLLARLHKDRPELRLHGVDFSSKLVLRADKFLSETFPKDIEDPPAQVFVGDLEQLAQAASKENRGPDLGPLTYDVVVCSEVLEHQVHTTSFISRLESLCAKNGTIIITVPSGPWEAMSFAKPASEAKNDWEKNRFHVHHFTERDLQEIFGRKKDFSLEFKTAGFSERGEIVGWWFVSYKKDGSTTGTVDQMRKWVTTRPYQRLAYCMIVRNEQDNLERNLRSIAGVVDEIHITDTGSTDSTKAIVAAWRARDAYLPKIFLHEASYDDVRPVPASLDVRGEGTEDVGRRNELAADAYIEANRLIDFGRARNLSTREAIASGADWILWADADETFKGAQNLRKYLGTKVSPSLVIRQHHMTLDPRNNPGIDTPFRVFKPSLGIQFYGVVHEQPSFSVNKLPEPAMHLPDVDIVHFGYLDEKTIRSKCVERNMALVVKDRFLYPERELGFLNVLRDKIHVAQFELERTGGQMTELAAKTLRDACGIHQQHFTSKESPYHVYSIKFYQRALMMLAVGGVPLDGEALPIEVSLQLAVAPGGLNGSTLAPAQRVWFATREEFEKTILDESEQLFRRFGKAYARRNQAAA